MLAKDKSRFILALADSLDVYSTTCSPQAAEMWFLVLQAQEIDAVIRAFHAHMRNPHFGRFAPKPADIMREIEDFLPEFMRGGV